MKKKILPAVAAAVVAASLRAVQMRAGFDEAGLPAGASLVRWAPLCVLLLTAVYALALAWKLPGGRGNGGSLNDRFAFCGNTPAALCAVSGAFLTVLGAAPTLLGGASLAQLLLALFTVAGALCVLYAAFALYRGHAVQGLALLAPVCCLVVYAVFIYRTDASNPVLAQIYVEILAIALLTCSALERAAFAFDNGSPRLYLCTNVMAFTFALAAAAEGKSLSAALLFGGWALVELGFLLAFSAE